MYERCVGLWLAVFSCHGECVFEGKKLSKFFRTASSTLLLVTLMKFEDVVLKSKL